MYARTRVLALVCMCMVACGASPELRRPEPVAPQRHVHDAGLLETDPDLNPPAPVKLLAIDWSTVQIASEADALTIWQRIAPTGDDWQAKLDEVPGDGPIASALALALLRGGNFTCTPPTPAGDCARPPIDVDPPVPDATFSDPCLRRMLALWALEVIDEDDLPQAADALRAIAAIPPPESQLVAAVLEVYPEDAQAARLELRAIAMRAGHRELVNMRLGAFDENHLIAAFKAHHIDGALDLLPAESHRSLYLAAIGNDQLHASARIQAISELAATNHSIELPPDLQKALVAATRTKDCRVAAAAARQLTQRNQPKYGPIRPRTRSPAVMMRAMCVLASFESLQNADEPSYLSSYIPRRGLELVRIAYDAYNDVDTDGDGDPHTERTATLVPRDEVTLPDLESMIAAFASGACTSTTCRSEDLEFRFGFRPGPGRELLLSRLEVSERPPCPPTK